MTFRTIIIPAASGGNSGVVSEQISGRVFATISATAGFKVRADNGENFDQSQGRYFGNPDGKEWSKLTFFNSTASTITLTYYSGNEMYKPDTSATISSITVTAIQKIQNAASYTKGSNGAVAGGAGTAFSGLNGADSRKSFSVFNNEAVASGNNILVVGTNGTAGHVVTPQTSYVVEDGGALNLTGTGFAYYVMEVFYSP